MSTSSIVMSPINPYFTAIALTSFVSGLLAARYLLPPPSPPPPSEDGSDEYSDDESSSDEDDQPTSPSTNPQDWGLTSAPYKLTLCINKELKMSAGKIAAQCSHAAVACYKKSTKLYPKGVKAWEYTGCAKIAVKLTGKSSDDGDINAEIAELIKKCKEKGLAYYLVEDAGRTQIAAGSRTVLGVGPGPCEIVDEVTGHLKLL